MIDQKPTNSTSTASSWNAYWSGDQSSNAFSSGGVNHEGITAYWSELFKELAQTENAYKMLDIATGNGALAEIALTEISKESLQITAVDISPAAISNITQRFPQVTGVVADARELPFDAGSFDLVTSQFGIEYAGLDAIAPAMHFVAPGGTLAFMLHIENGQIDHECRSNRDALRKLIDINFVPLATTMFEHGFKAVAGADRKAYDDAAVLLGNALPEIEGLIEGYGEGVAGGLLLKLHNDVGNIHSRMPHYQASDVLPWLEQMENEINAYIERMQSMLDASLSHTEFEELCTQLTANSFSLDHSDALMDQKTSQPLAWVLRAQKKL